MLSNLLGTNPDLTITIVRITLGVVFFAHGAQKMLGWFGGYGFTNTMQAFTGLLKIPAPLAFLVIAAEFFGGPALIVGLFSRLAAIAIFATMAGAMVVHLPQGLFMSWYSNRKGEGFEYHLLAMVLALVVVVEGAGAFSLDRALFQHSVPSETALQLPRR